jgi:hypothetical protein
MATVLKSYDWSKVSRTNKRERSRSYPWNDWFDGRIWQLEQGTDFDGPPASLERVIRTSANRRHIKVRIRIDGSIVILQQHGGEMPNVSKSPTLKSIKARDEGTNGDGKATSTKTVKRPSRSKAKTADKPAPRRVRRVKASA